ncbi:MAG TPA: protein kinase, partial [Polyangia bacterium]|nr:protein kinase [Polyangia bacterium]
GEKDFVKVCDFGIAKATTTDGKDLEEDSQQMLTIQGLVCGTPEYMSPEQARAEVLDGRADLYSAAIILYQLVTGDIPFKSESPMGIVSRHLAEPPTRPSARRPDLPIPRAVDELILRGMEKDRQKRYATAVEFREALEGLVRAASSQLPPLPPGIQASIPTTNAMAGAAPGSTAVIAPVRAAEKFGSTADLTSKRPRARIGIGVLVAALVAGAAAAAFIVARAPQRPPLAGPAPGPVAAPVVAAAIEMPAPIPAPAPPEAPPAGPLTAATPPASDEPPAHVATAARVRRHHAHTSATAPTLAPDPDPSSAVRVPAAAASVTPPPEATPAALGPREVLGEAERLLGQGEIGDACARGEQAKRMSPKLAAPYKFLGKCYMRGGRASEANDNYKRYLELSPGAPDAPFIKSMLK